MAGPAGNSTVSQVRRTRFLLERIVPGRGKIGFGMIIDCFPFFNELDLLEARLEYLDPVVDAFVISECDHTFSGLPKPFYYERNKGRYARFHGKIVRVGVEIVPDENSRVNEASTRNGALTGLDQVRPGPDDLVLIGDVDEIPARATIGAFLGRTIPEPILLRQLMSYYYVNAFVGFWEGTVILPFKLLDRGENTLKDWRNRRIEMRRTADSVPTLDMVHPRTGRLLHHHGWHLSYLGGPGRIAEKIRSFGHREVDIPKFNDPAEIKKRILALTDLYGRPGHKFAVMEPKVMFPDAMAALLARYPYMLAPGTKK